MKEFILVGGAVRDKLMGLKPKDFDYLAAGYTEEEMLNLGFSRVGKDFPVFLHPKTKDEYALPRKERSTGAGYNDFECITEGVNVEEDLLRRDLTINAMALRDNGELIDPFGGKQDLENKVLRHTSKAFKEDPLRVLRIARFRARYPEFSIAEETKSMISEMRNMLVSLTKERVFKELEKALGEERPELFFITLNELNVLDIIFPEIYEMTLVEHDNIYHMEGSVFNHTMCALRMASLKTEDKLVRFGTIYHDIGKVSSYKEFGDFNDHTSYERISYEMNLVKERYKVPNKWIKIAIVAATNHHRIFQLKKMKNKKVVKMITNKIFPKQEDDIKRILDITESDSFGRLIKDYGPYRKLDIYDSLFAITQSIFKKGERQYETIYIPGKEDRGGILEREFLLKAVKAVNSVSAKEYIHSFEQRPSIENIQQYLHRERIRAVAKAK